MGGAFLFYILLFISSMKIYEDIFQIKTDQDFYEKALQVFQIQFDKNKVYRSFCDLLNVHPSDVNSIEEIPFLPIQFFKSHELLSNQDQIEYVFESSGTTGQSLSKHFITDLNLYEKSFITNFINSYGPIEQYTILALLPNYLERQNSSLVFMVDRLIKMTQNPNSGFFLDQLEELVRTLIDLDSKGQKVLLIGVSFALLDLISLHQFKLSHVTIMETGGMKGKRKELIRNELHQLLMRGFGVKQIHSEYGMTELLSQAYSKENGLFYGPNWMRVLIRDTEDALSILPHGKTGGINIIDLANINSCAFIATQDLGRQHADGAFEILGRFDHSDIRGCNLMVL